MKFYRSCVDWPEDDVDAPGGLRDLMNDRQQITRVTFLKNVNRLHLAEQERRLGYVANAKQGMTMAGDYHVEYFRSTLHGTLVYGFRHSAIEYVFTPTGGPVGGAE